MPSASTSASASASGSRSSKSGGSSKKGSAAGGGELPAAYMAFYNKICKMPGKAMTSDELEGQMKDMGEAMMMINELLARNLLRVERFDGSGGNRLRWVANSKQQAAVLGKLDGEEQMIFNVVREAGNEGIWSKHIKDRIKMHQTVLNKCLKQLETQRIIKTVKSVRHPTRKIYMLYELNPSTELSGGPWYSDTELDTEFIKMLCTVCELFIADRTWPSGARGSASSTGKDSTSTSKAVFGKQLFPTSAQIARLPTAKDVLAHVRRANVCQQELEVEHIIQILNVLVFDGKVEKFPNVLRQAGYGGMDGDGDDDEWTAKGERKRAKREEEELDETSAASDDESESGSESDAASSSTDGRRHRKKRKSSSSKSSKSRGKKSNSSSSKNKSDRRSSKKKKRRHADTDDSSRASRSGSDEGGSDQSGSNSGSDSDDDLPSLAEAVSGKYKKSSKDKKGKRRSHSRSSDEESDREKRKGKSKKSSSSSSKSKSGKKRKHESSEDERDRKNAKDDASDASSEVVGNLDDDDDEDHVKGGGQQSFAPAGSQGTTFVYRSIRKIRTNQLAWTQVPCGRCTVFDFCSKEGPVNAEECAYFDGWLKEGYYGEADRKRREARIAKRKAEEETSTVNGGLGVNGHDEVNSKADIAKEKEPTSGVSDADDYYEEVIPMRAGASSGQEEDFDGYDDLGDD